MRRGFTLMELLVVLAIIGAISAVALSALVNSRIAVRDSKRIIEIANVEMALRSYAEDRGVYPENLKLLTASSYLSRIPVDPRTKKPPAYQVARDGSRYYLGTNLESFRSFHLTIDADAARHGISGDDISGCAGEIGYYCYDVSQPLP